MLVFTIKIIRQEKRISLLKIHKETHISRSYLYKLDNNLIDNTNIYALYKIAKVLNVNVKELLYSGEDIYYLKKSLYYHISKYGYTHPKTLKISKIIDLIITKLIKQGTDSTNV
jgi:transcriptional regulator with XRE-family HTH domain